MAVRKRHVQVYERNGWRFAVVGANGERMDQSEPYANRSNARRAGKRLHPTLEVITVKDAPKAARK